MISYTIIFRSNFRDSKVTLLKDTAEVIMDDVVLGQYVGDPDASDPKKRVSYTNEPTVPVRNSNTSTFAMTVLRINNDRWTGVPFIIRAGKGRLYNTHKYI